MADVENIIQAMIRNPQNVRFSDCLKVCTHFFGEPRVRGSHHFFSTPWEGAPLVNLQRQGNKAKTYQVRQIIDAVERMKRENNV